MSCGARSGQSFEAEFASEGGHGVKEGWAGQSAGDGGAHGLEDLLGRETHLGHNRASGGLKALR